jgi:hypothetical protein
MQALLGDSQAQFEQGEGPIAAMLERGGDPGGTPSNDEPGVRVVNDWQVCCRSPPGSAHVRSVRNYAANAGWSREAVQETGRLSVGSCAVFLLKGRKRVDSQRGDEFVDHRGGGSGLSSVIQLPRSRLWKSQAKKNGVPATEH